MENKIYAGGSDQKGYYLFGIKILIIFKSHNKCGWFRLFGKGLTWTHNSIKPIFSERIGKRKKIRIGNYRFGFLK